MGKLWILQKNVWRLDMEQEITVCLNCGNQFEGNFCPVCGQAASTKRFTLGLIVKKCFEAFDFEHGMLLVIKELTIRPGTIIRQYIAGRRKPLYDPLRYLFWTTALMTLLNVLIDPQNAYMAKIEVDGVARNVNLWTTSNMTAMFLISLPIYAMMTRLFFREWKFNFSEHLILNMYSIGHANLINAFMTIILFWSKIHSFSTFAIMILVPVHFFVSLTEKKRVGTFIKAVLASCITAILFFVPFLILFALDMHVFNGGLGLFPKDLIRP